MKIIVTGATGLAGSEVVRQAIADNNIQEIICLVRRPMEITHPKITTIIHKNFLSYNDVEDHFRDCDACLWCLGISQMQVTKTQYAVITYDYTIAAAKAMLGANPDMHFIFLSGNGADRTEKSKVLFARLKGKTENALLQLMIKKLTIVRPDAIWPKHKNKNSPLAYKLAYPFFPLVEKFAPSKIIGSVQLAKAMLYLVNHPQAKNTWENMELRKLAEDHAK
ncbi:MAG: NAD(P)H-binding protein [Ferruginibacter sp.]|nr:NAD(P)H-binding protein [Ferruginibacter sp.]